MQHPKTLPLTRKISGRTFTVEVPVTWEPRVDDYVITSADAHRFEHGIAATLAREGPVDGDSFRFMRAAIGLESRRLAELLGVRPETVSRWENGARAMDRGAWFTLASIVLEHVGEAASVMERLELLAAAGKGRRRGRRDAGGGKRSRAARKR